MIAKALIALGAALALPAAAATLFVGGYPDRILAIDEGSGRVVDTLTLANGLPYTMQQSADHKRLYVETIGTTGIEVIDLATRKVTDSFTINSPTVRYRFSAAAPDAQGRYLYGIVTEIRKLADHYEVSAPKYAVIDIAKKQVVRTVDIDKEEDTREGWYKVKMVVSNDGKWIYLFSGKVTIVSTATLKTVDRIDLGKPETGGHEEPTFGATIETMRIPDSYVSVFTSADPYVHNKVFGIGRFNLSNRSFDFTPVGPAPANMLGLQVAPDGKSAYTIVSNGTLGNKRCEFWRFDLTTNSIAAKAEFACRPRFYFGMSSDGAKLYIYGAGSDFEIYDAATLRYEKTWDIGNDMTEAGLVVGP